MKEKEQSWRGVKGVTVIWHGSWGDPELQIKRGCFACAANYYDIENAIYEWCKDEHGIDYAENDESFNDFCQIHREEIIYDVKRFGKWQRI